MRATWRDWAEGNYAAAAMLFDSQNPFVWFAAATLGHHALEMHLKAALVRRGMTVFDPKKITRLDPKLGLGEADCVWGHSLLDLAGALSRKRPEFDLKAEINITCCIVLGMPMTVRDAFAHFDQFFSELRYPQELNDVKGLGQEEKLLLDELVARLKPFVGSSLAESTELLRIGNPLSPSSQTRKIPPSGRVSLHGERCDRCTGVAVSSKG